MPSERRLAGQCTLIVLLATTVSSLHVLIGIQTWLQQVEEDIGLSMLVLPRLQAKIARRGGRYDPQLVKRSSE